MLVAKDVSFEYPNHPVLTRTSVSVGTGERIGLVGPNGIGKSTLLKILAGVMVPTTGQVTKPAEVTVGYMPQEIDNTTTQTALQLIEEMTGVAQALKAFEAATANYKPDNTAAYELALAQVDALGAYTLEDRLGKVLADVGLGVDLLKKQVDELSGGQRTKLLLAVILLARFDVYLLDEPTNNLDLEGIRTLERFIGSSKASFVIVSHDRKFLRSSTTKIAELKADGQVEQYSLGYDEYVVARQMQKDAETRAYADAVDEQQRLKAALQAERTGTRPSGNLSSDKDKLGRNARVEQAAKTHAKALKARQARMDSHHLPPRPAAEIDLNFDFGEASAHLPDSVVRLTKATVEFGSTRLGPFTLDIRRGEKVVVVGPNGSGKSTLLRLLGEQLEPTGGDRQVARGAKIGYVDQHYQFALPNSSVLQNLTQTTGLKPEELYNVLARFNLKKGQAESLPSELSPGQRARAVLAGLVASGTNVLLLDEPTNHLDVVASDELQRALSSYKGTIVLVSHDRELINGLNIKPVLVVDGTIANLHDTQQYMQLFVE